MKSKWLLFLLPAVLTAMGAYAGRKQTANDRALIEKVLNWQMNDYAERKPTAYKKPLSELSWLNGALFRGMVEWGKYADDPSPIEFVRKIGEEYGWQLQPNLYHADHLCMGQTYCELYRIFGRPEMIGAVKKRLDDVLENPSLQPMDFRKGSQRWTWCDALFMAPPVYGAMFRITGEERYLDFMDSEYRAAAEHLFDPEYNLFYRDANAFGRKERNGKPLFWGRGNGWVFGGLALLLRELPVGHPKRPFYETLFRKLAEGILACQDEKGSWHASMLDHVQYPAAENSGSSFFVYGLAWGVNNGILKGRKYRKAALAGWEALKTYVDDAGKLGSVQRVAASPQNVSRESTAVYGVGAFLLAGIEILEMTD